MVRLGIPTDAGPADIKALRDYLSTKGDPIYGHQPSDQSVAGIPSEGRVRVRWRDADSFDLPGGEKVTLRCPDWSRQDLGYGSMDPATRFSAGVAPR